MKGERKKEKGRERKKGREKGKGEREKKKRREREKGRREEEREKRRAEKTKRVYFNMTGTFGLPAQRTGGAESPQQLSEERITSSAASLPPGSCWWPTTLLC